MSVSIPSNLYYALTTHLEKLAAGNAAYANDVTYIITHMIYDAVNDGYNDAVNRMAGIEGSIRGDIDSSMNTLSSYIADIDHDLRTDIHQTLVGVIETIGGVEDTIMEETTQNLTRAYDSIATSYQTVGGTVEKVIYATAEKFDQAVALTGGVVTQAIEFAHKHTTAISDGIIEAAERQVDNMIKMLIPAEAAQHVVSWGKVLSSSSAAEFLRSGVGDLFKGLDGFVDVSIDEMKAAIQTVNDKLTDASWEAMQKAKER